MKVKKKSVDDLEKLLFSACRTRQEAAPGAGWRAAVMWEIRFLGAHETASNDEALFGRFAWRFAAAAGLIALVLLVYVFSSGVVDYQQLALQYFQNPIDFII
jgi:hypothetical protein